MPEAAPASVFASRLLRGLVDGGVRDIVVCPGSRSQALALVAYALDAEGRARLHVRIDERVAGFLALGLAVESGAPVAVVTTSGTAVANLHPAVLEAHHAHVPLVLLTADRPAEAHGVRSNQTTPQAGLYGAAARACFDLAAPEGAAGEAEHAETVARAAVAAALGHGTDDPGPVQVNAAFREPLSSPLPVGVSVGPEGPAAGGDGEARGGEADGEGGGDSGREQGASADPADVPLVTGAATASERRPAPDEAETDSAHDAARAPGRVRARVTLAQGPRTLVVAGAEAGERAEEVARLGGWPLVAEVCSGARFGPNLVAPYRELLADADFGGAVERVVVFGHPTLSREVPALLARGVETVVVAPTGTEFYDPTRAATLTRTVEVREADRSDTAARAWCGRWVMAGRRLLAALDAQHPSAPDVEAGRSYDLAERGRFVRDEVAAIREPVTRRMLVEAVWRFTWPHNRLVLGASRLIREADRVVPGKRVPVHANRGLSGIDGTLATAFGVAAASQDARRVDPRHPVGHTRLLVGDLAFLHDVGALLIGAGEPQPLLQVIVGDDGGGSVFDELEVAATADPAAFERVVYTPQNVELGALARAYGWHHSVASNRGELDQALSVPPDGVSVLEVPLPR